MYRNANTTGGGGSFDEQTVQAVWNKGAIAQGYDPRFVRKDACGVLIERSKYGQTVTYGWEIDHMRPIAQSGSDALVNLQPLYWQNNRHKSDSWPSWSCAIRA